MKKLLSKYRPQLFRIGQLTAYCLVTFGLVALARDLALGQSLQLPEVGNYGGVVQDPDKIGSFESGVATLIVGLVLNVRYLLVAIAITMFVFAGFRMVTAQGNEDAWKSAKVTMIWAIVGLALVGLSGEIVRIFSVGQCAELGLLPSANSAGCTPGGILKNPQSIIQRSTLFNRSVQYLITFIKYLIGAVAVLMLTRNAIRMAANSAGDELDKDKKNIIASIIGLLLVIIADPIINNVFFSIDKNKYPSVNGAEVAINYAQGVKEIVGFTNFLVTILTPIAILVIVAGGVMYMTANGNAETEEKAKRMIFLSLLSILIIYGAFAIVSTFISGQFDSSNIANPAAQVEGNNAAPSTNPTTT